MKVHTLNSILKVKETDWQQLIAPAFPLMSYDFLATLESSGCLGSRTGWMPKIMLAEFQGEILGAMISYIRNNSFGEYIFDFQWADAFARHGVEYYPKLTSAIPFSPVTHPKILLRNNLDKRQKVEVSDSLLSEFKKNTEDLNCSSSHALFITQEEIPAFEAAGFFIRDSFQYHWQNRSYSSFSEFLTSLRSKRRAEILRERSQVQKAGVEILRLTGAELQEQHAQIMYDFYMSTMEKKSGFNFLTESFFQEVFDKMKNNILFVLATKAGQPVAGALNYYSDQALYGRHWGCVAEYKALHFEVCYYQGIEFAIEKKIPLFEGGAQGEHKFNRGFLPLLTYSAHHFPHPDFSKAIEGAVRRERRELVDVFKYYEEHSPFAGIRK
jgi:predicted N-acyltransferase